MTEEDSGTVEYHIEQRYATDRSWRRVGPIIYDREEALRVGASAKKIADERDFFEARLVEVTRREVEV